MLQSLITNVSAWIEQWLSRSLFSALTVSTRDGTGTDTMMAEEWPVTAVTSVEVDGKSIPASTGPSVAGYAFSSTKFLLRGYTFTRGQLNVKLTYTAGYAAIPGEIEQSCLELCALRYRERPSVSISSKTLGSGETVSYTQQDMPKSVLALLNNYKRRLPL